MKAAICAVVIASNELASVTRVFFRGTKSLQIAKEKLRQFESARMRGEESPFPTKTPVAEVLAACTPKSAQTDLYYLRRAFGPVCQELEITSRKLPAEKKPAAKRTAAKVLSRPSSPAT